MRRMVIGCGYLGKRVAAHWSSQGDEVWVTTRSAIRAQELSDAGYRPIVCDVTDPSSLKQLPDVDTLLFAVGFDRDSGQTIEEVYVEGLGHLLAAEPRAKRFLYISSTGVYGQAQGELVDESSVCEPTRPGGRACLAAERLLQESAVARSAIVLRLAGIYGPGRVPNLQALQSGREIVAAAESHLNLIHVDDAVRAVVASAVSGDAPTTYVVSDNRPVLRREYYREVARLYSLDPASICFVDNVSQQGGSAQAPRGRKGGSKRVCSAKIMRELDLRWAYPSYREGLAAVLLEAGG